MKECNTNLHRVPGRNIHILIKTCILLISLFIAFGYTKDLAKERELIFNKLLRNDVSLFEIEKDIMRYTQENKVENVEAEGLGMIRRKFEFMRMRVNREGYYRPVDIRKEMKILLVEDEPEMADLIRQTLESENFLVETASDYRTGLDKIISFDYDCILLDIMLPDGSGLDLLHELKNLGRADSVIVVSAKDSLDDKITGLDMGADDYLVKPFHMAELNARIKSVIRRRNSEGKKYIAVENVKIDTDDRQVYINDRPLVLNRKELDMLVYLTVNRNRLVSKSALAENVWGDHIDEADHFDFIYSQIKNLRKKLKDHGAGIEISAVYGMGYKLTVK